MLVNQEDSNVNGTFQSCHGMLFLLVRNSSLLHYCLIVLGCPASLPKCEGEIALDNQLLDLLASGCFPANLESHARQASVTVLYLYMILGARTGQR